MKWRFWSAKISIGATAGLLSFAVVSAENFQLHDRQAPYTQEDLLKLQETLQTVVPVARAATVSIKIGKGAGSGVVVSPDGLVMTAAHVTGAVGKDVTVIFENGDELPAITLGLMADTDAALLQIKDVKDLPFAKPRKNNEPVLGEWLFSLGHSGGFDVDRGSVLRLCRLVRIAENTIQTDGTLIGGDSGGPLFDMQGRVVAIHSRVGHRLPVNLHIPMHVFTQNWQRMLDSEFIGDGPFAQRPEFVAAPLGLKLKEQEGGLLVEKVAKQSLADKAGFKVGDIITEADDVEVKTYLDFGAAMNKASQEKGFKLKVTREGKITELLIKPNQ